MLEREEAQRLAASEPAAKYQIAFRLLYRVSEALICISEHLAVLEIPVPLTSLLLRVSATVAEHEWSAGPRTSSKRLSRSTFVSKETIRGELRVCGVVCRGSCAGLGTVSIGAASSAVVASFASIEDQPCSAGQVHRDGSSPDRAGAWGNFGNYLGMT